MRAMKRAEDNERGAAPSSRWGRCFIALSAVFALLLASPAGLSADVDSELGAGLSSPSPARFEVLLLQPRRDPRIDPIVAAFIDSRLRFRMAESQWAPLPAPEASALLRAHRLSEGSELARVRELIVREEIALALLPIVYAAKGQYIVELWIIRADVSGSAAAQVAAEANELGPAVDALLNAKLPRVAEFDREAASEARRRVIEDEERLRDAFAAARAREPSPKRTHWAALAFTSGSAIGPQLTGNGFYIHTLRARLELRPKDRLGIGLITGYANLPGDNGRAHNLPILAEINYRVPIAGVSQLSVPIRFALGYLPFNGPMMRTSVGLNIELTPDWELGADFISPTLFRSPDHFHFAFDLALEVTRRFGRVAP